MRLSTSTLVPELQRKLQLAGWKPTERVGSSITFTWDTSKGWPPDPGLVPPP